MQKVRKVELILYGYGTRIIYELGDFDMDINLELIIRAASVRESPKKFKLTGTIHKIKWIGKKHLKKLEGGEKQWMRKENKILLLKKN